MLPRLSQNSLTPASKQNIKGVSVFLSTTRRGNPLLLPGFETVSLWLHGFETISLWLPGYETISPSAQRPLNAYHVLLIKNPIFGWGFYFV